MTTWTAYPDGSFDLNTKTLSLKGAFPAIDGIPVRPTAISIDRAGEVTTIRYTLAIGELELRLTNDATAATLDLTLRGMPVAPRSIQVLAGARATGVTRCFKQARGMGGGSGLIELPSDKPIESFGITSLLGMGDDALIVYAIDHTRFEQVTAIHKSTDVCVATGFQTEGIPLTEGKLSLPTLRFVTTTHLSTGLRAIAETIALAMQRRPLRAASYHWCSWYYLYQNLDMTILREYLDGFARAASNRPLDFVQVDAGYAPANGDWLLPSHRFPGTLKPAFDLIRARGHRPGVWIGPFMVGNRSQLAKDHPDWLLCDTAGNRVTPWRHYEENRVWGYRDEETYVLDTSHPDAFEYLRTVFRTLRAWGAQMFKTDFMFWGLQDSTKVRRYTPGKTGVEYFRDVLTMIRDEIGEESFWLGCIAPYMPFIGFADAMRIGGDVGASWTGGFGPQNMLRETVGSQHFNNVFWQNDPDVILLRNFHIELNDDEITSLALWQAILGGVVATSDPLHELSEERLALWRFVQPTTDSGIASLPLLGQPDRPLVAVRRLANGDTVVLVFNTTDRRLVDRLTLKELGVPLNRCVWARTGQQSTRLGITDHLLVELPPHASALFHIPASEAEPGGSMLR